MTTLTNELSAPSSPLSRTALLAAAVLVPFAAYSLWVVADQGYFGFLGLAGREPWAMQMLIDLFIACSIGFGWLRADARKRGLASWPFLPLILTLGSVGLLAYVIWRAVAPSADRRPR